MDLSGVVAIRLLLRASLAAGDGVPVVTAVSRWSIVK